MKKIIMAQSIFQDIEGSETIFKRRGITLFPAWSSEEMLNLHGVKRADLLITAAAFPLMGGAKLCSLLRSDAELKDVSIILISDDNETSLSLCREAGANVVLRKPVDVGALLWKASELLAVPQRKDMRVLLRVSIKDVEGNTPLFAQSQNISISGMQLETDRVLKVGDQLNCAFNIAHSEVSVTCMVARVYTTTSERYQYGVKFMNCDTKSLVIIEHFVKAPARN